MPMPQAHPTDEKHDQTSSDYDRVRKAIAFISQEWRRQPNLDEIAEAVLYFLTASNFVTGQVLAVDGGLSQR